MGSHVIPPQGQCEVITGRAENYPVSASAIVLNGGSSRRMGRDKASLPFGDESLLQRAVRLVTSVTDEVVIVGRSTGGPANVRVIADPIEGQGPLSGLLSGLDAVASSHVMLVACDLPLLAPAVVVRLLELVGDADACVPRIGGIAMPACAVYATRIAGTAREQLATGDRSLRGLLDRLHVRWVSADELRDVDPDLVSFVDCDTPDDYGAALARAGYL